jgi:hypothetical protein
MSLYAIELPETLVLTFVNDPVLPAFLLETSYLKSAEPATIVGADHSNLA